MRLRLPNGIPAARIPEVAARLRRSCGGARPENLNNAWWILRRRSPCGEEETVGFGHSSSRKRSKCRISAGAGRICLEEARWEGLASKFRAWLVRPQDRGFGLGFPVTNAAPQLGFEATKPNQDLSKDPKGVPSPARIERCDQQAHAMQYDSTTCRLSAVWRPR